MSVIRFILLTMVGLDLYWWWFADQRVRSLRRPRLWRTLVALFILAMLFTLTVRLLRPQTARTIMSWVPLPVIAAQYLWHLLILPISVITPLLARAAKFTVKLFRRPPVPTPPPQPSQAAEVQPSPPQPTRRQFVAAALAVPPVLLAGATAASLGQLGKLRFRSFDLAIPNLPPKLAGLMIAHLSDFHAGRFMTPAMMRPIIDQVNDMKPDLVLITGDLIDYALIDLPPAIDEILRLRPAIGFKHGVAMCMGNHDVFENAPFFKRDVRAAGVPLAADSARIIDVRGQALQLLGIDWYMGQEPTYAAVRRTAKLRDPLAFPILLAHHPHAFDEAARLGFPLTLAGHTHGGQLMATQNLGAGPVFFRYWSGLYRKPDGSQLIVSNGIGNWFPLRINAPAEVIKLTLRPA